MRVRRYKGGPTPATTRTLERLYAGPQRRAKPFPFRVLAALPAGVVYSESVSELIVFTHRLRTNQAPLATGRYRR